ncbi:MAG: transposase [Pirellulales bacterium]|nr:transposase [Pirellulales bacterium]
MSDGPSSAVIPDDLAACQALLREHGFVVASLTQSIAELQQKNQRLEEREKEYQLTINELLQRAFARRSERYLSDPRQLALDFKDAAGATDAAAGLAEAVEEAGLVVKRHVRHKRPRKPRRERLPEHLPRHEVIIEAPADLQSCPEHGERKIIGYDETETLVIKRPEIYVLLTKSPKLACEGAPQCGVAFPERPTGLVEGNRYDTSVAAEVLTNKYGFHLPIYRQQDMFAGSGWTPSRSTLLNLAAGAHFALRPLVEHLRSVVLADDLLGTDDTTLTLLVPKTLPEVVAGDPRSERTHELLCEAKAAATAIDSLWTSKPTNALTASMALLLKEREERRPDKGDDTSHSEKVIPSGFLSGALAPASGPPTSSRSSPAPCATTWTCGPTSKTCSTGCWPARPTTTTSAPTSGAISTPKPSASTASKNAATRPIASRLGTSCGRGEAPRGVGERMVLVGAYRLSTCG